jgi:anti-sigma regulatory factor (Ser/Thr protein kinase)
MLIEERRLRAELAEAGCRQRRFRREMLLGFTDGRLCLCYAPSDLPRPLPPLSDPVELTPSTMRSLRKRAAADASGLHISTERTQDFETAVGEASMNAVQHGGGGRGRVHGDAGSGVIQVWVEDHGAGIAEDFIHRAVEQGWTTGGFGHGFFLMRSCADRIYLLTGPAGTTVVLEQGRTPPEPAWFRE